MIRWPFVSRAFHDLQVEGLRTELAIATVDRSYWRGRAEQLIDAALARAGAIHQPTMEKVDRKNLASVAATIVGAMGIKEIDSSKGKVS